MIKIRRKKVVTVETAAFKQAVEERAEELSREAWERVAELEVHLQDAERDKKELEYRIERFQQRLPKAKKKSKVKVKELKDVPLLPDLLRQARIRASDRGPELEVDIEYDEEDEVPWGELDEAYVERARPAPTGPRRRRRVRPNTE